MNLGAYRTPAPPPRESRLAWMKRRFLNEWRWFAKAPVWRRPVRLTIRLHRKKITQIVWGWLGCLTFVIFFGVAFAPLAFFGTYELWGRGWNLYVELRRDARRYAKHWRKIKRNCRRWQEHGEPCFVALRGCFCHGCKLKDW